MEISRPLSVTPSLNQNKSNSILKFTYLLIISPINSFSFRIHINVITMGRSRRVSVMPSQIRNKINSNIDCYKHRKYLSSEEVMRAKLDSYH